MDVYLRFVNAWYSKEFIEVFLHPQDMLQIPPAVNAVLGGNVGDELGDPLAHVGFLLPGLAAEIHSALSATHARARTDGDFEVARTGGSVVVK